LATGASVVAVARDSVVTSKSSGYNESDGGLPGGRSETPVHPVRCTLRLNTDALRGV